MTVSLGPITYTTAAHRTQSNLPDLTFITQEQTDAIDAEGKV